jgi:myosin heavy subunit
MPKQFQSNTIMPNKSVMVEDEDEYGGAGDQDRRSDAFGLDGIAASLPSNRDTSATSRSAGSSGRDAKLLEAAQAHAAELQGRVNDLEINMKTKDEEIRRLEESTKSSMSSEWVDVKQDLERRLEDAERLNQSMKEELERVHMDQANIERDLRSQLDNAKRSRSGDSTWKSKHDKVERDYQDLQAKLKEQRKVTEEVKQQASGFLAEMRAMADGGGGNIEREERLQSNVHRLEEEVKEWKARYARTKTQLRNMRASSLGLSIQRTDATRFTKDDGFTRPDGLVKDVHITKFQIAIDELLHIARAGEPSAVLDYMKGVVVAVRNITQDIATSSTNSKDDEISQRRAKLKSNVSATANNVITASKNFATSNGMSPVSLLDAAASHLTAAIVELVRTVKIRPTPAGELEDDDDGSLDPLKSPGYFSIDHSMRRISGNDSVYSAVSSPPSNAGRQHGTDRKQSLSHPRGSFTSGVLGNGLKQAPGQRARSEVEELKVS